MNKLKFLSLLGLCLLLTACQKSTSLQANLQAPSLKENLPKLIVEATKWDKDAYVYSATVPIANSVFPWKARVVFHSPSKPYASIILTLAVDGNIELNVVEHTNPILRREPILDRDWSLDSYDAVAIFVSHDQNIEEFLVSSKRHCSDITLERFALEEKQPVVWSLSLFDCSSTSAYYYLDPITGDVLNLSRSVIPDAILISPSP